MPDVALEPGLAVHPEPAAGILLIERVRGDQTGSEQRAEVLHLVGAEVVLGAQVAGADVNQDRVATDVVPCLFDGDVPTTLVHHAGQLELGIQPVSVGGIEDRVLGPDDGLRVALVTGGRMVEDRRLLETASAHVLLVGAVVTDGARSGQWGQQVHLLPPEDQRLAAGPTAPAWSRAKSSASRARRWAWSPPSRKASMSGGRSAAPTSDARGSPPSA